MGAQARGDGSTDAGFGEVLVANYPVIERVIEMVARRHRLKADAADELGSIVRFRLVDNDYAILRKYEGRSSFATYLTTVVERMLLDERIAQWGRWRPSTHAQRLGETAKRLEQLIGRDRLTFDEARQVLRTNFRVPETDTELEAMYASLPQRTRRRSVSDAALANIPAAGPEPVAPSDELIERLWLSVARLPLLDRQLIHLRFARGWTVRRIAVTYGVEPRAAYRRFDAIVLTLRRALIPTGANTTVLRPSRSRPRMLRASTAGDPGQRLQRSRNIVSIIDHRDGEADMRDARVGS